MEWPCQGLNETSVEAEPRGENAILLFNHSDNLFSLSVAPPHTLPPSHCYSSPGPVKLFILEIHTGQAEATVNRSEKRGMTWKFVPGKARVERGFSLHRVPSLRQFNLLDLIRMVRMPSIGTNYSTPRQMSISISRISGWDDFFVRIFYE